MLTESRFSKTNLAWTEQILKVIGNPLTLRIICLIGICINSRLKGDITFHVIALKIYRFLLYSVLGAHESGNAEARDVRNILAFNVHSLPSQRKYDENKYRAIKRNQSHKRHFSFLLINFPPSNANCFPAVFTNAPEETSCLPLSLHLQ